MTKATMNSILSLIADIQTEEAAAVREAVTAELNKGKVKSEAASAGYESVKQLVMDTLTDTPATIGELYDELKGELPDDFTKGKLQYAITRLWKGEVTKVPGKVSGYCRKA